MACVQPRAWSGEVKATDFTSGTVRPGCLERLHDVSLGVVWRMCGRGRLAGDFRLQSVGSGVL